MKKLIILLLLLFAFCSCEKTEAPLESVPETSSSETASKENPPLFEPEFSDIESYVNSVLETNLKSALDNTNLLEAEGISFRAEKIMVFQNNRFSCDLVLEKGGKEERIRVIGIWLFAEENYKRQSFSAYESFIKVKLGGVCVSGENSISVCSLEKAVVFDPESFSDFCGIELSENFWPVGVFGDESGFYVPAYSLYGFSKMFVFDKNNNPWAEYELSQVNMGYWLDFPLPVFHKENFITGEGEIRYFISGNIAYNITGGNFYKGTEKRTVSYEDYDITFYKCYETYGAENKTVYLGKYAMLSHKEKGFAAAIPIYDENFDYESPDLSLFYDGKLFFRANDGYSNKINLNFGKIIYNDRELYNRFVLEEKIADSPDKKYSLWRAENNSAGDGKKYVLILKENESGKTVELSENSGSISKNASEGFLKNGDVYIMNNRFIKIYSAGTNEISFDSEKTFGKIYDTDWTGILTFRRDPKDFSFIVLRYEHTAVSGEDSVYTLTFLSPEGKILEEYESDIKVPVNSYGIGIQNVVMYYSEDKLIFTALEDKGYNEFSFSFDMETKTFSK